MAYNVLKGTVQGSVDQHADQEIDGVKVFKNTISASVFYDTDAQSPCATIKDVAILKIEGSPNNCLLTYKDNQIATAPHNLTFRNDVLTAPTIEAHNFVGRASQLKEIPVDQFAGIISGEHIAHGPGLRNIRGKIQVNAGPGIDVTDGALSIAVGLKSGLSLKDKSLVVDPSRAPSITDGGQNLSDSDILLVSDISRDGLHSTTLGNFYNKYLSTKIPQPAGDLNHVQLKGRGEFNSSPSLSFDTVNSTLTVDGRISTSEVKIDGQLECRGSVVAPISTITQERYAVGTDEYTLLCDSYSNAVTIVLPPACNNRGRILNIKKVNKDKYNLRSFPVIITVEEGIIDLNDQIALKTNYSSRTVQSDGENWWVISAKGT